MKPQNEMALIVAFYFSKFDYDGLAQLGYSTYREAFQDVGQKLGVKPTSIKNMRDEFDPYYDNSRKGWYQKQVRPSRKKVMATFDDLSEEALRALVLDILKPETRRKAQTELLPVLKEIRDTDERRNRQQPIEYTPRGPTGRRAEEFFISRFHAGLTPFSGVLKDRRDEGVGFDFEIIKTMSSYQLIEIKGLAKALGGVTFTDKEWKVANEAQTKYFLGLVTNVHQLPKIGFLQNPARHFTPSYHLRTTVSVTWGVNTDQISKIELSP